MRICPVQVANSMARRPGAAPAAGACRPGSFILARDRSPVACLSTRALLSWSPSEFRPRRGGNSRRSGGAASRGRRRTDAGG
jgi:hypothetical protein